MGLVESHSHLHSRLVCVCVCVCVGGVKEEGEEKETLVSFKNRVHKALKFTRICHTGVLRMGCIPNLLEHTTLELRIGCIRIPKFTRICNTYLSQKCTSS